jgi:hypothetical protein
MAALEPGGRDVLAADNLELTAELHEIETPEAEK